MQLVPHRLCLIFGTSWVLLLATIAQNADAQILRCPPFGTTPTLVKIGKGKTKQLKIRNSNIDNVCMLVHVRHADPSKEGTAIELKNVSPSTDFILTPVARSFEGFNWGNVAGAFSRSSAKIRKCNKVAKKTCVVALTRKQNDEGRFFLLTRKHFLTKKEKISRFLMQTTFGPTKDMVNNWPHDTVKAADLALWVKNQMELPPTKHREFFRKKADYVSRLGKISLSNVEVQHPCSGFSRWRRNTFTEDDNGVNVDVWATGVNNQFAIIIGGVLRSVVDEFKAVDNSFNGHGAYQLCWKTGAKVGGVVEVMPRGSFQCRALVGGNPAINLDAPASFNIYKSTHKHIDLPAMSNFEFMPSVIMPGWGWGIFKYDNESYKLKSASGINNPTQCGAVPVNDYSTVVGKMAGGNEYVWYSGYSKMLENSVESPLADGGLSSIAKGAYNCANAPMSYENADSCFVSTGNACEASTHGFFPWRFDPLSKTNVVVCGSEGEVGSEQDLDPSEAGGVQPYGTTMASALFSYPNQKRNVQYMIFLKAQDQLRQRMAWALSQILVITPNQIETEDAEAEPYLKYYDIFVKHAFGNYRDVLKAVSYSPMMAEMLSFLESKSAAFVLKSEGRVSRPDENFAREIMQLFSIGLYELRMDGSVKTDSDGVPILTYSNSDIQTFARAWTGFKRETNRFNREAIIYTVNRLDPMAIFGKWRDPFPKMDLDGNFIGDGYPLCEDLPPKQFLRAGAQYRLLGSAPRTKMEYETIHYNWNDVKRIKLDTNSKLYEKLCNMSNGACDFKPIVTLDENLVCTGKECEIDNLNAVIVKDDPSHPLKYEYVRPACVETAFYESGAMKKIVSRQKETMCLHKNIDDVAMDACCLTSGLTIADYLCEFSFEKASYGTTEARCHGRRNSFATADTCDWTGIRLAGAPHYVTQCQAPLNPEEISWHWTNQGCTVKAKVNPDGMVATVHDPETIINGQEVSKSVDKANMNFFKVNWKNGNFPKTSNQCASNACSAIGSGCLCDVEVSVEKVFDSYPALQDVIDQLSIGSPAPDSFDAGTYTLLQEENGVSTYQKQGDSPFSKNTIFAVTIRDRLWFYKNVKSTVSVVGSSHEFRNPPTFLNVAKPDTRDATYETEAVLDFYFNHRNTAPFLATRILQRFGISNPSPNQIFRAARAFKNGQYTNNGVVFGDGKYGNLGALIASIVLDKQSTSQMLDADPSTGSLREPLLKLMSFFRAMEYEYAPQFPSLVMTDLQDNIGQEAQLIPNVFSFFLPEYSPPGKLAGAGLTGPEAQVLNAPKVMGLLNGLYSLIEIGMSKCFGGFGDLNTYVCDLYKTQTPVDVGSRGFLSYTPTETEPEDIVDEMIMLLTGGQRMNPRMKAVITNAYTEAGGGANGVKMVQKLLISTPQFHATTVVQNINKARPQSDPPQPSNKAYKSIVYVNLMGGIDSFNVLVPHSGCTSTDMFSQYQSVRGQVALHKNSLHTIDATSSGQVCSQFGLHGSLPALKTLYDDEDLVFFSNVGVLSAPATKANWKETQKTALFSHNTQQEEISFVDFWDGKDGRGVGGRMVDVLSTNGYKPGSISISGLSTMLRAHGVSQTVSDASGYQQFNPSSVLSSDITSKVRELNGATSIGSNFYAETWSDSLFQTLDENELLFDELQSIDVTTEFPDTDLGGQLEAVAKLMKTKDVRGTDRDVFYTAITGFDMHAHIAVPLVERLDTINGALEAFVAEMKLENSWNDVAVVFVSEFGRTLMGNTGNGTDHAWSGNYFVASGSVDGGKILGNYPTDLTNHGPYVFEGVVVPEWPWEALWNGLAEWFGIATDNDLTSVIPNRAAFTNLWSSTDIFSS